MKVLNVLLTVCLGLSLVGCMPAASHRAAIQDDSSERLTVGSVQRKIHVGMPAPEVAAALGSPNIVTTDEKRREVWIYDKISTDRIYSTSEGGISILIIGASGSTGAVSTTQRTLTVIIKYDDKMKVRDFAYHSSRF